MLSIAVQCEELSITKTASINKNRSSDDNEN